MKNKKPINLNFYVKKQKQTIKRITPTITKNMNPKIIPISIPLEIVASLFYLTSTL